MPLRVVRRKGTRILWITGTIEGRRIRESTGTDNPDLAEIKRADREARLFKDAVAGIRPTVPFSKAADSYLAAAPRGFSQRAIVSRLREALGTRMVRDMDQTDADRARHLLLKRDAAPATVVRHIVSPINSILEHSSRRGWCERPRLEWPKVPKAKPVVLLPDQAEALIAASAAHFSPIVIFLICTGARVGEALKLDWSDVDLAGGRCVFWEGTTKTGARRVVELVPRALIMLAALPLRNGAVFRRDDGQPYTYAQGMGGPIRTAWRAACARAGLPGTMRETHLSGVGRKFNAVHTPHDCRHTWASWHYALHRDLLKLKHDGGWSSVRMVEHYAHLIPDGHQAAIRAFLGLGRPGTNLAQSPRRTA
jgi:integrase